MEQTEIGDIFQVVEKSAPEETGRHKYHKTNSRHNTLGKLLQ